MRKARRGTTGSDDLRGGGALMFSAIADGIWLVIAGFAGLVVLGAVVN